MYIHRLIAVDAPTTVSLCSVLQSYGASIFVQFFLEYRVVIVVKLNENITKLCVCRMVVFV